MIFIANTLSSEKHSDDKIADLLIDISPEAKKKIMTVRQAMEEKYVTRGRLIGEKIGEKRGEKIGEKIGEKRGEKRGIYKTAKKLLTYGAELSLIHKSTGLPIEEIQEMIKNRK